MSITKEINDNIYYVGCSVKNDHLFENLFEIKDGVSYNSYLILDKYNTLIDTVDYSVSQVFLNNIENVLNDKKLDYLVINHMELDHSASISLILEKYKETKLVLNKQSLKILNNFLDYDVTNRSIIVSDKDVLNIGHHTLTFHFTPMIHWPEVMMCYEELTKTLFSADAFGTFGALKDDIIDVDLNIDEAFYDESRRYYSNIVGKFGIHVLKALDKLKTLDIAMICPLHGPMWTNYNQLLQKYELWASYKEEKCGVVIAYASMYGQTKSACMLLKEELNKLGMEVVLHDMCHTEISFVISSIFKYNKLVIASPTYNNNLHPKIDYLLTDMAMLDVKNKEVSLIENGTWAPNTCKLMKERLQNLRNVYINDKQIKILSRLKDSQKDELKQFALSIKEGFND